jgi:hypothetical protein
MRSLTLAFVTVMSSAVAVFAQPSQIGRRVFTIEELSAGSEYWTPGRRAAAKPRDVFVAAHRVEEAITPAQEPFRFSPGWASASRASEADNLSLAFDTPEALSPGIQPLQNTTYPHPFTRYAVLRMLRNIYPYSAVGKLFFTIPNSGDFVCSASVIRPHLLLTARHCVFDWPTGIWATNVVFFPGYYNGPNQVLGGSWKARALITWTGAGNSPQLGEWDLAFIQTFRKNGGQCQPDDSHPQIESFTGFLGYFFGGGFREKHWDDFGYPATFPFNGRVPYQCEAGTGKLGPFRNTIEIGCDHTGGTSGGPWLISFAPGTAGAKNNLAGSLNSFRFTDQPLALNGPQFLHANFKKLLDAAEALPCP